MHFRGQNKWVMGVRATGGGHVSGGGCVPTGPQTDRGTFGAGANGVTPVSVNVSEGPFVCLYGTCACLVYTCLCEAIWRVFITHVDMWHTCTHTDGVIRISV